MDYNWVFGRRSDMNGVVLGPYEQSQAEAVADKLEDGQVFVLPTKDQSKATQMIKAELFRQTQNIEQATKRMSHTTQERKKPMEFRSGDLTQELRRRSR